MNDPQKYDNKGLLGKGNDETIMEGHIRDLQRQIEEISCGKENPAGKEVEPKPNREQNYNHSKQPGVQPGGVGYVVG